MFFGAVDFEATVATEKPPAALWLMVLSVKVFGLHPWSVLLPQAVLGVGAAALMYATVRLVATEQTALLAGFAFTFTPVAVLLFRYNNPDALMLLLMNAVAYTTLRAVTTEHRRWMLVAGALLGVGFLAKHVQIFLLLPAITVAYLKAGPGSLWRRTADIAGAASAAALAAGWWLIWLAVTPSDERPYFSGMIHGGAGGMLPYRLDRFFERDNFFTGRAASSEFSGTALPSWWGEPGLGRLIETHNATQYSWLVPAALILGVGGLYVTRNRPRTDPVRAVLVLWSIWLVTAAAALASISRFHGYYTASFAAPLAGMAALGGAILLGSTVGRMVIALGSVASSVWAVYLINQVGWKTWLAVISGFGALGCVVTLVLSRKRSQLLPLLVASGAVAALCAPVAWSLNTAAEPRRGGVVYAGPAVAGVPFSGPRRELTPEPPRELVEALRDAYPQFRWAAASVGGSFSALQQLGAGVPIMFVGGYNRADPTPTYEDFRRHVAEQEVRYFIEPQLIGPYMGGTGDALAIESWVKATFEPLNIGGATVYDLTRRSRPASTSMVTSEQAQLQEKAR